MSVPLPHDPVLAEHVVFAAGVAGDVTARNAHHSQQHGGGAGEVLAMRGWLLQKKVLHRIDLRRNLNARGVAMLRKVTLHRRDFVLRSFAVREHSRRELLDLRILGQLRRKLSQSHFGRQSFEATQLPRRSRLPQLRLNDRFEAGCLGQPSGEADFRGHVLRADHGVPIEIQNIGRRFESRCRERQEGEPVHRRSSPDRDRPRAIHSAFTQREKLRSATRC